MLMLPQNRKRRSDADLPGQDSGCAAVKCAGEASSARRVVKSVTDLVKFVFFCLLLIVPVYAIAISAIKHDWVMMIIDALLVPVGFVHGVLLFFGFIS